MDPILISALATACLLTAIEAFLFKLSKWRGLLAIGLNVAFCLVIGVSLKLLLPSVLAATFIALPISLIVERVFVGVSDSDLPNRIPPR